MPLLESNLNLGPVRRGKVRDIYDLGDRLLLVATDRISAFDWILPTPIPDKGRILTRLSNFWFATLGVPHHLLETSLASLDLSPRERESLTDRAVIVRKSRVVPFECVARGYLSGSGWKEYQQSGTVCGIRLPRGLQESSRLDTPIFTPATKAESGHDENIPFERMASDVGTAIAEELRQRTLEVYRAASERALARGILIADTKLEWGFVGDELILIDEVLTPDSSRFWPSDQYQAGRSQASFDKQFVRDWLESTTWDKNSPPPVLPVEIVAKTRARYLEAYERITGQAW